MTTHESSVGDSVRLWLRNGVLVALIVLLLSVSYLFYRMSVAVARMEQAITAIGNDVQQVTSTVAKMSGDVSTLRDGAVRLMEKVSNSVPVDQAKHAIDEALAVGASIKADAPVLSEKDEKEISALLSSILDSDCTAEVGGEDKALLTLYATVYARYRLVKNTLKSPEDFIERVGTESVSGKPYLLVTKTGVKTPLGEWLRAKLRELRAK
jgi:hypothetical protein